MLIEITPVNSTGSVDELIASVQSERLSSSMTTPVNSTGSVDKLIASVQRERLEPVKEFILYVIKYHNAHTSHQIGKFLGMEYRHVSVKLLCGKKLKMILREMRTERLIYLRETDCTWQLVNTESVFEDKHYHMNEPVRPSDTQLEWRTNQIELAKSTEEYKALSNEYLLRSDCDEPAIDKPCGKKTWTACYIEWRKLLHNLYKEQMKDTIEQEGKQYALYTRNTAS
eukprot:1121058_1